MFKSPTVSIVIPTFNSAHFLKNCLQSVIAQTFDQWEAIIVNNFSKDNTIEVVESFSDPRMQLINFNNRGIIAASRNKAIGIAMGEYVAFLDADDLWYPRKLEVSISYLDKADIVYHDLNIYTAKGKRLITKIRGRRLKKPIFVDLMKNGPGLTNSSVVAKKDIITQAGGLCEEESIVAAEDFDLWLKISQITEKFYYIPKTLGAYWVGESNTTEMSQKQIDRLKSLYNRHLSQLALNDKKEAELYLNYSIGRIKQRIGLEDEARELFKLSIASRNIKIRLKSIVSLFFNSILCKQYRNG